MDFHPIAEAFPLLEGKDFENLRQDIATNGLLEPIWTYEGKILDGRNRYRACLAVGVELRYREYTGDDPVGFVVSLNLNRRHLNESQRAVIAARIANMTKRDAGRIGGKSNREATANLQLLKNGKIEVSTAAELLNVSPRLVATVKAVERDAPELIKKIESGEMTANYAEKAVRKMQREKQREEMARAAAQVPPSERWRIWHADMRTWKAPRQYDFIITDPPYPREYLPLWESLAERASEWLKDDGLLIAMSGQSYLDDIMDMMTKYLDYYWTACYLTPGQPTPLRQVQVNTTWKPLLMFTKIGCKYQGKIFGDVFASSARDKRFHEWGQSVSGMYDIISKICLPGQYILDPFCGAATTGVAALRHGCLFDGVEIDEKNVKIGMAILHD
jgi:16S rRNA G966 N2-methylase RsmD